MVRARDGFPPGAKEEGIPEWSPDQTFLRLPRHKRDQNSNAWEIVYEYIPFGS